MKDINEILQQEQKKAQSSFRVPENYFDSLTERIMSNIPADQQSAVIIPLDAKKKQNKARTVHLTRWAAACACVIIIGVTSVMHFHHTANVTDATAENQPNAQSVFVDDALNEAADYVMIDNQDMYSLLADD